MSNDAATTRDALREMIADTREVFSADGPETPQVVRDVIEYVDSWLTVYLDKTAQATPAAATGADEAVARKLDLIAWNAQAVAASTDSVEHLKAALETTARTIREVCRG